MATKPVKRKLKNKPQGSSKPRKPNPRLVMEFPKPKKKPSRKK
jgi:hypothetical protein